MKGEGRGTTVVFCGFYLLWHVSTANKGQGTRNKETANTANNKKCQTGEGWEQDRSHTHHAGGYIYISGKRSCIHVHEYRIYEGTTGTKVHTGHGMTSIHV